MARAWVLSGLALAGLRWAWATSPGSLVGRGGGRVLPGAGSFFWFQLWGPDTSPWLPASRLLFSACPLGS